LKKIFFTIVVSLGILCSVGFYFNVVNLRWPFTTKEDEVMVSENLPFEIERNNPVPEVRHWDLGQRTFYYFNMGLKTTGGYSLELLSTQNNLLKIKVKAPRKDQMVIQALTFPYLLISLPQGNYHFEVVDNTGHPVHDTFRPKNPPLNITLFLPRDGRVAKRKILRDPYLNNKAKQPALIALEGLFDQDEMLDFANRGVLPEKAVFSTVEQKWYILLSKAFENLGPDEKTLLHELINKTVLTLAASNLATVEIITDPTALPPIKN
jgi:PrcB C-terminal